MLNEIKTKIVLAVQRQQVYDPVLKDTVDKVLVTFSDGVVNGYLADDWDNLLDQVDSMLDKAFIVEPKAFSTSVGLDFIFDILFCSEAIRRFLS